MNVQEYIRTRVDPQIDWYDKKAIRCQRYYKIIQIVEIILAASIPLLSGYTLNSLKVSFVVGTIGAIITILESLAKLNKYHENWIEYRATCEMLRYHKNLYLTHSGPYCMGEETVDNLFIKNMEQIVSSENNQWKSLNEKAKSENKN